MTPVTQVLVDAECTHDGSVKHLEKFDQWGWDTFEQRFFDPKRMSELRDLQVISTSDFVNERIHGCSVIARVAD